MPAAGTVGILGIVYFKACTHTQKGRNKRRKQSLLFLCYGRLEEDSRAKLKTPAGENFHDVRRRITNPFGGSLTLSAALLTLSAALLTLSTDLAQCQQACLGMNYALTLY